MRRVLNPGLPRLGLRIGSRRADIVRRWQKLPILRALVTPLLPVLLSAGLLSGCGGGGGTAEREEQAGGDPAPLNCTGSCADTPTRLTVADVETVIARAVAEARARNAVATIAVVDRVGNVLGVFKMNGATADSFATVTSTAELGAPVIGGLESVNIVPAELAAIAKAVTGAYLSSEGNAFSSRTASQIVQENFNPGERDQPSGPLFGVQFSQLPCGDFVNRFAGGVGPGPRRSPLGLSADAGGLPLYKNGTPVGGVGVIADRTYSLDKNVLNFDSDLDELIATAGTFGFAAPTNRRADAITLGGKTGKFSEAFVADLAVDPTTAGSFASINGSAGNLVAVPGYYDGGIAGPLGSINGARVVLAGVAFGQAESGIRPAAPGEFQVGGQDVDAFVFVDGGNTNRFAPRDGTDTPGNNAADRLTANEVRAVIANGIDVANRARAQIRQPDGSQVRVTVSVVDTNGAILGMARTRDAPVFGADVSLQKARTAAFFSGTARVGGQAPADVLRALPGPLYLDQAPLPPDPATIPVLATPRPLFANYVSNFQTFIGQPNALEVDGDPIAFADRSVGNLARPTYPDGPAGSENGPLSKGVGEWSVFSSGVQLDLVYNAVIHHIAFVLGVVPDVGLNCTGTQTIADVDNVGLQNFLLQNPAPGIANGLQIFPGSVPIYRGSTLVGAFGVSGDGVDQDDMVAFLGVHNASTSGGATAINNAPPEIRADRLALPANDVRLRYVNCPQAPFNNSTDDGVCNGK